MLEFTQTSHYLLVDSQVNVHYDELQRERGETSLETAIGWRHTVIFHVRLMPNWALAPSSV
jgi:hypothetical protein